MATNSAYILSVSNAANLRTPETGEFEFRLGASEAFETQTGLITGPAAVTDGRLSINFGGRTFSTTLKVTLPDVSLSLFSKGRLMAGGYFEGDFVFSSPGLNMNVSGQLGGTVANQAAYLFYAPINGTGRGVVGATSWGR